MIIETKRKTQTVRLNFIKISLNLSVFFIYWLVFAQPLLLEGWRLELLLGSFLCIQLLKDDSWLELEGGGFYLKFEEGTMGKFAEFSVADSRVLDR
ncbi:hypothetical protein HO408_08550 [Streptococcus suis]|nr:hypothetical protein [Streptococcus suis]